MFGRIIPSGKGFSPQQFDLTGYWRGDDYSIAAGLGTLVGSPSAGPSGGRNLTSARAGAPPTLGPLLNGRKTIDFRGFPAAEFLTSDALIASDFLTLTTYSGWFVANVHTISTDFGGGSAWANNALLAEESEDWVIGFRSTGPAVVPTNFPGAVQQNIPGLNTWALTFFRFSAGVLEVGVNGNAMTANACNNVSEFATRLLLGIGAQQYDGGLAMAALSKTALTDADRLKIRAFESAYYGQAF